ncbi:MAG: glycosyltransferase family 9 protein, partial [Proteobacteria bacterium]|nr:glycosyltransferase family 9 protein [Pseudomonadota bacterium]
MLFATQNIYLIRRMLSPLGDVVCTEPVISLTFEMLQKAGIEGEIWFQGDNTASKLLTGHPMLTGTFPEDSPPPFGAQVVLDITSPNDCPSIASLRAGDKVSAVKLFCASSSVLGQTLHYDGRSPRLYLTAEEEERVLLLQLEGVKRVVVQESGRHWWKTYPHLKKLVQLLLSTGVQVFVVSDKPITFAVKGMVPLVALPIRDLMVHLKAADLVIGLDSGITHISAALGVPTYGIFGPTDPEEILGVYNLNVSWNTLPLHCPRARC